MSETQSMTTTSRSDGAWPGWFNGKDINEALFCRDFLFRHELVYSGNPFFTPEGRLTDLLPLKEQIFTELEGCAVKNIPRTICNIAELMKLSAHVEDFPPRPDEIHVQNGTLHIDGSFTPGRSGAVRSRFPVRYDPNAGAPELWLRFLSELLHPEDTPPCRSISGTASSPAPRDSA